MNASVETKWLEADDLDIYASLLPSGLGKQLNGLKHPNWIRRKGIFALGLSFLGLPVGACLLQIQRTGIRYNAEIISVAVGKIFLGQGYGRLLMHELISQLKKLRIREVEISYALTADYKEQLDHLTKGSDGWETKGSSSLYSIQTNRYEEFQQRFEAVTKRLSRSHKMTFQCLSEVEGQINALNHRLKPPSWAALPTQTTKHLYEPWGILDPSLSCVMLVDGEVQGWCLCHRISDYSHRVTVAYVDQSLQRQGFMMVVVCECVKRIHSLAKQERILDRHTTKFGVLSGNAAMTAFAQRHLKWLSTSAVTTTRKVQTLMA